MSTLKYTFAPLFHIVMSKLDHLSVPPPITTAPEIIIPSVYQYISNHNIPIYEIRKKDCGLVAMDIVFSAGRSQERAQLSSSACAAMMREGAGPYHSQDFSEQVDFYGATISVKSNMDFLSVKAVFIKDHMQKVLNLIEFMLSSPRFENEDFELYKQRSKELLRVQLAKNDVMAYRLITEAIYGSNHPYGYNSTIEGYDQLNLDDIIWHFNEFVNAQNCQIFIAGDIDETDRNLIDRLCKNVRVDGIEGRKYISEPSIESPKTIHFPGSQQQSSIRIGRRTIVRTHDDFDGLNFLSNILGGYFGSRLINVIRERKGLTYSIYSLLDTYLHDGDLIISTEVSNANVNECIHEIYNQMAILREDLVKDDEIELAKNYMTGNYINLFDGPFNSIRAIKSLALTRIPLDRLHHLIKSSLSIDSYQIRDIAKKYFDRNDFWNVIVGIPE